MQVNVDPRCTLLVASNDNYSDIWEPFFIFFRKYWPDCPYQIVLASETKTFSVPGLSIRCPRFYKPGEKSNWGDRIVRTLQTIDTPFVFLMLDDMFLYKPTNQAFMDKSLEWMENDPLIGKFQWRENSRIEKPGKYAPYGLSKTNDMWRVSAFPAIWRRDLLIRSLLPGDTPWTWEVGAGKRSKSWKERLYDSHVYPIFFPWGGGLAQGKWLYVGIALMKMNGIPVDFTKRGNSNLKINVQSWHEIRQLYNNWSASQS